MSFQIFSLPIYPYNFLFVCTVCPVWAAVYGASCQHCGPSHGTITGMTECSSVLHCSCGSLFCKDATTSSVASSLPGLSSLGVHPSLPPLSSITTSTASPPLPPHSSSPLPSSPVHSQDAPMSPSIAVAPSEFSTPLRVGPFTCPGHAVCVCTVVTTLPTYIHCTCTFHHLQ